MAFGLNRRELPDRRFRNSFLLAGGDGEPIPAQAAAASAGELKNMVVIMRFSDHVSRTLPSVSDLDILMNATGGDPALAPTGSVRDYYLETSYGALTLNSTVFAWVTLPNTEAYYANGNSGLTTRTHEALRFALDVLDDAPSVSFLDFDVDSDGQIDAITFLHSGYGAEWGGSDAYGTPNSDRIWSHKWSISNGG